MIVKFKSFISKTGMKTTENNNVRLKKLSMTKNFYVFRMCRGKFDCLVYEMFFIPNSANHY